MKRLIIGIAALVLLLAAGIAVSAVFCQAHEPTAQLLEEASAAALCDDWDLATILFGQARNRWEYYWHFTAAFADHTPMDEMDELFAQLQVLCRQKSRDDFPALCARLSELAEAMADSHRFHWWTLM